MNRRQFIAAGAASSVSACAVGSSSHLSARGEPFALDYAPHFGQFDNLAGGDEIEQIKFMADQGFRSIEDNGMRGRTPELQARIRAELDRHGMRMGVFVAHADFREVTFASTGMAARDRILADVKDSIEVAERVGANWCTVVPGCLDGHLEMDFQTANVIENLRRCVELCEPRGLVLVLEPLNHRRDHPNVYLTKMAQAWLICRAVASPSCKILCDLYHQQITEGNLIPNLDACWDEIAYVQVGDHPGRNEPGTGEIHYTKVFRRLASRGYAGIVGMEHGKSGRGAEGERAVLAAYRAVDPA